MDSVIDTQRSLHEEIERLEQAIVKTLLDKPKSVPTKSAPTLTRAAQGQGYE